MIFTKQCPVCKKLFKTRTKQARLCSDNCKIIRRRQMNLNWWRNKSLMDRKWYNKYKKNYNIKSLKRLRIQAIFLMGCCCEYCRIIPTELRLLHIHHTEYTYGREKQFEVNRRVNCGDTHGLVLLCHYCHHNLHQTPFRKRS